MNELQASTVMIGLFALRCVVPLLVVMALGHMMNRLLDRWAAEEAAQEQGAVAEPWATPALPPRTVNGGASAPLVALTLPCWLTRSCDEAKCINCAAYRRRGILCWQARLIEEGKLPDTCPTCPRYLASPTAA